MSLEQIIGIALIIAIVCMIVWLIDKLAVPIIILAVLIGVFGLLKWLLPKIWQGFSAFNIGVFNLAAKLVEVMTGVDMIAPAWSSIVMAIALGIGLFFFFRPIRKGRGIYVSRCKEVKKC